MDSKVVTGVPLIDVNIFTRSMINTSNVSDVSNTVDNTDCTVGDDILQPSNLNTDVDSSLSFVNIPI